MANELSSVEKAAMRDQKSAERTAAFDKLPKFIQFLVGIAGLGVIAAAGLAVFFAVDILLLDAI